MIFKKRERKRSLSQKEIQDVFDELEFSQSLLEPLKFTTIPVKVSLRSKDHKFSGLVVKYKGVIGFIPKQALNSSYYLLKNAEEAVKEKIPIDVYFKKFEEGKNLFAPWQWQTPIFTMLKPG